MSAIDEAISSFAPKLPIAVALSGGADSCALLLACARRWPGKVLAVHVNHGLQAAASQFESACIVLCAQWKVPLHICRIQAHASPGQSPEDAARTARYSALDSLVLTTLDGQAVNAIAIAHNADDQVETVLLALGRGAGVAGISAMPAYWQRATKHYYRPLLGVSSHDIRQWLREQGGTWVEDPTNADTHFLRNHIRHELVPALKAVFPNAHSALARSAEHAAQAQRLLDQLADIDLAGLCVDIGLKLDGLRTLSTDRMTNAIRRWLKSEYGVIGSAAQMKELVRQVHACATRGHQIRLKVGGGFACRQGSALIWCAEDEPNACARDV